MYGAQGSKLDLAVKKVKRQCTTFILATVVELPSPMICAKTQPQGILGSGEEVFCLFVFFLYKGFTIYWHGGHLGQQTATILAIFRSPTLGRIHLKFEQNCLGASKEKSFQNFNVRTHGRRTISDHYNSS